MRTLMMNGVAPLALSLLTPSPPTDGGDGTGGGGAPPAGDPPAGDPPSDGSKPSAGKGKGAAPADTGGQNTPEPAWYEALPDSLKSDRTVQRHAKLEDAITALVGAEKRLGVPADQLVRLPTTPEERAALFLKLGAPESPEGYQITLAEGASDADKAMAERFAKHMHEKGPFLVDAVAAAVEFLNGETTGAAEQARKEAETRATEGEAALRKAWGADYDTRNREVGLLLLDESLGGGKELVAELEATPLGDKVGLLKLLGNIAAARRESTGDIPGKGTSLGKAMTPAEARSARLALENDPIKGKAFRDPMHSMHKEVIRERDRYFAFEAGRNPDAA